MPSWGRLPVVFQTAVGEAARAHPRLRLVGAPVTPGPEIPPSICLGAMQETAKVKKAIHHLLLGVVVYVLTFMTNGPDFDLWARLAVGSIVLQTGHVLQHDIFSYLPTKALWIDHEWGSGVVFYCLARLFGEHGIFILKAVLIYAIFTMVQKTITARGSKKSATVLFYAFLGYALFPGIASLVRSQMFTYLFFAIWLYELERVRRQERKILWVFPCTMLFWVNMHGGFVAGVGLVLLYALGEVLSRKSPLPYLWILLSILPAMLINPYGFALWRSVVEASLLPRPFIPEWQPISLSGPMQSVGGVKVHYLTGYMILAGMTFVAAGRSIMRTDKLDWTRIVVMVALFLLGARHQRHAVFFVLAAATLFYDQFDALLDPVRRLVCRCFPDKSAKIQTVAHWGLGYGLPALVALTIIPRLSHNMTIDYRRFPVGSLEFIKQNGLTGNVATGFDWGSYASWKLHPQCKVMFDGRYEEVFPNDVFDLAMRFSVRQGDWSEVIRRYHTDIVVLPKSSYTQADLPLFPEWKPVYQDFVSVVLLPRDRPARSYVRPDFKDPAYSREDLSKPIVAPQGSRLVP